MSIFERNKRFFELSNHLGNVLATVSDKKIGHDAGNGTIDYYTADVISAQDYYPFGMGMPGRTFNSSLYRYGFQKQEIDRELYGGAVSFKYRIEDPRIGRFLSVDPLMKKYPHNSPYAFAENKIGLGIELEGAELLPLNSSMFNMSYSGENKAPCNVCLTPTNGSFSVGLNANNVPGKFKYDNGNPRFSPASVNVGTNGAIQAPLPDNLPYPVFRTALPSNDLPALPGWTWNSNGLDGMPTDLGTSSQGTTLGQSWSGSKFVTSQPANPGSAGKVADAATEAGNWIKLYTNDLPIWNAYNSLNKNTEAFNTATTTFDTWASNGSKDVPFLQLPKVRADMINFIADGSIPPLLNLGSKASSTYYDNLNYSLNLMFYGIQFLQFNNNLRAETINNYKSLIESYERIYGNSGNNFRSIIKE